MRYRRENNKPIGDIFLKRNPMVKKLGFHFLKSPIYVLICHIWKCNAVKMEYNVIFLQMSQSITHVVDMASDGCTTMNSAVREFDFRAGLRVIWCHCLAHRLYLALSIHVWGHPELCKSVEEAMPAAYTMFNRRNQRRKKLHSLAVEFGRVNVPAALIDMIDMKYKPIDLTTRIGNL